MDAARPLPKSNLPEDCLLLNATRAAWSDTSISTLSYTMSEIDSPEAREKLEVAKGKKDSGDQAFKEGNLLDALRSYHESIMYLKGINQDRSAAMGGGDKDASSEKKKTEADEVLEKIYANMSACHIKQGKWQRALESANRALAINENNYKAQFRKGKAEGELGYFEKAEKTLEDLLKKNPTDGPTINAELSRLRAIDKERERAANQKLKGFLSKGLVGKKSADQAAPAASSA